MSADSWDVRLTLTGTGAGCLKINLPVALSAPMIEAGLNRATITITKQGILVEPYAGDGKNQSRKILKLPDSWLEEK